jgi:hypothetical protein
VLKFQVTKCALGLLPVVLLHNKNTFGWLRETPSAGSNFLEFLKVVQNPSKVASGSNVISVPWPIDIWDLPLKLADMREEEDDISGHHKRVLLHHALFTVN